MPFYTWLTLAIGVDWWVTCHAGCHRGMTKSTKLTGRGLSPVIARDGDSSLPEMHDWVYSKEDIEAD
jgi:hypothetical protein